jgi:hypothetical protein
MRKKSSEERGKNWKCRSFGFLIGFHVVYLCFFFHLAHGANISSIEYADCRCVFDALRTLGANVTIRRERKKLRELFTLNFIIELDQIFSDYPSNLMNRLQ